MTCRHSPGDASCSSHPYNIALREKEALANVKQQHETEIANLKKTILALTAELNQGKNDAAKAEILDMHRVGHHVALKVKYPDCQKCSYEGVKVLVYLCVPESQLVRWKVIDPHFRDPEAEIRTTEAKSPAARFPASPEGWNDAIEYIERKNAESQASKQG